MKFFEYELRGCSTVKFWKNMFAAVAFATQDTIDYYRDEKDVDLEMFEWKSPEHASSVTLYFREKGKTDLYVCSYINIRETED